MAEPFVGEIRPFAFGIIPQGWIPCDGRTLLIKNNANMALFSVIGTLYGGDGITNFAIPDLQGRVPIHPSSEIRMGTFGGEEEHYLTVDEIPSHNHLISANSGDTDKLSPKNAVWGSVPNINSYATTANVEMSPNALSQTGKGEAHNNMQPYCPVSFCIAIQGLYPPRG